MPPPLTTVPLATPPERMTSTKPLLTTTTPEGVLPSPMVVPPEDR